MWRRPPNRVEVELARTLLGKLAPELQSAARLMTHGEVIAGLESIAHKPKFLDWSGHLSVQLVDLLRKDNERNWRDLALHRKDGRRMYTALQEQLRAGTLQSDWNDLAEDQFQRIVSIPGNVAERLKVKAMNAVARGERAETVMTEIRMAAPHLLRWQVGTLARTSVSSLSEELTELRASGLGLGWYVWRTSEDSRVRRAHQKMDGVVVAYDDPPNPESLFHERSTLGHYLPVS